MELNKAIIICELASMYKLEVLHHLILFFTFQQMGCTIVHCIFLTLPEFWLKNRYLTGLCNTKNGPSVYLGLPEVRSCHKILAPNKFLSLKVKEIACYRDVLQIKYGPLLLTV